MMKIAVAGKGGSGKTTIAGTLARLLARRGEKNLLAIDADSNPNLAVTLGIPRDKLSDLTPLTRDLLERYEDEEGNSRTRLAKTPDDVVREFGIAAEDGVVLLLMGRVEHAGAG